MILEVTSRSYLQHISLIVIGGVRQRLLDEVRHIGQTLVIVTMHHTAKFER
jgi:hypothetical protein